MKKIESIEQIEDEEIKSAELKKLNIRKISINVIIITITLFLILMVPKKLLNLMPGVLGEFGWILGITLFLGLFILILDIFNNSLKVRLIDKYSFQKKFFRFFDYYGYFINTIAIIYSIMICFAIPSSVDGKSMVETLHDKDAVVVYHFLYTPKNNDIVVIYANPYTYSTNNEYYVKRCKAIKGDKIEFIYIDGSYRIKINDVFIDNLIVSNSEKEAILTKNEVVIENNIIMSDHILVISDNRNIPTIDSRRLGFIHVDDIIGKVVLRFFPFSDIQVF